MKIQSFIYSYDKQLVENELKMMKLVHELNLAPKVETSYISEWYSIIISKEMDIILADVIKRIHGKPNWKNVFDFILEFISQKLLILHINNIVHGDAHWNNIMFVALEPFNWNDINPIDLQNRLTNGKIEMKFIDFGMSSLKADIDADLNGKWKFYEEVGLKERFKNLGCLKSSYENKLFEILKFYDITNILGTALLRDKTGDTYGSERLINSIVERRRGLKETSGCDLVEL